MFVLTSDYEGVSNSLMEALAMGIPVIATDCPIGGSRTCIKDGYNGLLISVGDADGLCHAMLKLSENSELSEYISNNAIKIRKENNAEIIARKIINLTGILQSN